MRQSVLALLWVLGCAALLEACGGEPAEETVVADSRDAEAEAPLVMPDYPEPVRGHLVTRSAGADDIAGEWPARAGSCEGFGTLQVVAAREGTGAIFLFYLPPEGAAVSTYPVVPVDSTIPQPPAVRVGVQFLRSRMGDSFGAVDGTVELNVLNRRVSGRFALPLVNMETRDTALYAGVFSEVRVRPWSPLECGTLEESEQPADTLAGSAAADSLD